MRRRRWIVAVFAFLALTGAGSASASRIVFAANRISIWYGEIYRIDADGTRVDLSRSPAADVAPAVSPGGKRVAFVSARGGHVALYVVGIDGRGLRRVSPPLFRKTPGQTVLAEIAWSPDGRRVAVDVGGATSGLYLADLRGGWRTLSRAVDALQAHPAWSPDGSRLAYTTSFGVIRVVSATGKAEWSTAGLGAAQWSAHGRLAVSANSYTIHVYGSGGGLLSSFTGGGFAWSPTGERLASVNGGYLESRRGGVGKARLRRRLAHGPLTAVEWVGPGRVRVPGGDGWIGFDVAHDRPWKLAGAAAAYGSVVSGRQVVSDEHQAAGDTLMLSRLGAGGGGRALALAPSCGDDVPFQALQLTPNGRSVVYQSGCLVPSADIYSIEPDGTGLRGLTDTPTDETQPALSPDGNSVVYVQQQVADRCQGCPQSLWVVPAAGGMPRRLTAPTADDDAPFAESPSWSPDGTQVAFARSGANAPSALVEVPSAGGEIRSLGIVGRVPEWGPQRLAFVDDGPPAPRIDVLDPATGTVSTVATLGKDDFGSPAWSRDGRLAYLAYEPDGHASIALVGANAKPIDLSPVLPLGSRVAGLAWSPDGARFAFTATDADGVGEVYTIGVDGTGLARVTTAIGAVGDLSWG